MPGSNVERELARGTGLSIINLVNTIIEEAHLRRASDIHIDPGAEALLVRFRIDGALGDAYSLPKNIHSEIITRIKVLSRLRTDEHQSAQDGRFRIYMQESSPIDIRVSIIPTHFGENAVLRLLMETTEQFSLETLGFNENDQKKIECAIQKPYGMILATGPTGSGKTTTLYTILKMLNTERRSIVTIEDPIEYSIEGVSQIQTNSRAGLTFANGLRSILRQDPDIIMVGEIRDTETAYISINTALTGHLLLSTLHTNDAATTLPRLFDMDVEPYLIASTVNIAIGQRLVRKICPSCKQRKGITLEEQKSLSRVLPEELLASRKVLWHGTGCGACNGSGYRGRIGIQEVLVLDDDIRQAILRKAHAREIKAIAQAQGMTTMIEEGFQKCVAGTTTIEEILRVSHE